MAINLIVYGVSSHAKHDKYDDEKADSLSFTISHAGTLLNLAVLRLALYVSIAWLTRTQVVAVVSNDCLGLESGIVKLLVVI